MKLSYMESPSVERDDEDDEGLVMSGDDWQVQLFSNGSKTWEALHLANSRKQALELHNAYVKDKYWAGALLRVVGPEGPIIDCPSCGGGK